MPELVTNANRASTRDLAAKDERRDKAAWRAVGWFGGSLAFIGVAQVALHLYPDMGFGIPEWEFGITAQILSALPFPSMGIAAFLSAMLALGKRRVVMATSILLAIFGVLVLCALGLFWLNAPLALRSSPAVTSVMLKQTIARTTLNGFGFGLLYLVTAGIALRRVTRTARRPAHA
jgi:cation transport ATPase